MLLDIAVITLFGGYSVLCWTLVPRTWRGDLPDADEVVSAKRPRAAWLRFVFMFGHSRTSLVHLLVVNAMLLAYLMVRLDDLAGGSIGRSAYLAAGVFMVLFAVLLVLWAVVAASGRPRFFVPPHLRRVRQT